MTNAANQKRNQTKSYPSINSMTVQTRYHANPAAIAVKGAKASKPILAKLSLDRQRSSAIRCLPVHPISSMK